ncbi:hypothetical protein D3C85_1053570 [compost metagenome]
MGIIHEAVFHVRLEPGNSLVAGFEVEAVAQHIQQILVTVNHLAYAFVRQQHNVAVIDQGIGRPHCNIGEKQMRASIIQRERGLIPVG